MNNDVRLAIILISALVVYNIGMFVAIIRGWFRK
jgi:hypothetical protein